MKTLVHFIVVVVALIFSAQAADNAIFKKSDLEYYYQLRASLQNSVESRVMSRMAVSSAITLPGLGSYERAVDEYAVPRSRIMALGVYQDTDDGPKDVKKPYRGFNLYFSSKAELDAHMREKARMVAEGALTNSWVNKDETLHLFTYTTCRYETIGWVDYLYTSGEFKLIKQSDGSYSVPDLSNFEMDLVSSLVYEIPGALEVRIEANYNPDTSGMSGPALISDSISSPTGESGLNFSLEPGKQYIDISTEYALSGTNGLTLLKIIVTLPDEILIFGPMGEQIPHISDMKISDGLVSFRVTGPRNKSLAIEATTAVGNQWTEVGRVTIPYYGQASTQFQTPLGDVNCIFRVRAE